MTAAGGIVATAVLAAVILLHREEFTQAVGSASLPVLLVATALQLVALLARTEAWHHCVRAAGGTLPRQKLYRAAGIGYLSSQLNSQLAAAARIAALRRVDPGQAPRVPALIAAELPIVVIEGALAAIASFTLVGPLGLPWWLPLTFLAVALLIVTALRRASRDRITGFWSGLAVLRNSRGRITTLALVLVAVFAQIVRNWLMLQAVGVDASVFDATAVLIAMVVLAQLPIGPGVGAGAVVLILGTGGVALTTAAGVLLTATGAAGALVYVTWAGLDAAWARRQRLRGHPAGSPA